MNVQKIVYEGGLARLIRPMFPNFLMLGDIQVEVTRAGEMRSMNSSNKVQPSWEFELLGNNEEGEGSLAPDVYKIRELSESLRKYDLLNKHANIYHDYVAMSWVGLIQPKTGPIVVSYWMNFFADWLWWQTSITVHPSRNDVCCLMYRRRMLTSGR